MKFLRGLWKLGQRIEIPVVGMNGSEAGERRGDEMEGIGKK